MIKLLFFFTFLFSSLYGAEKAEKSLIVYFDTPNLYLLDNNISLKYKAKKYISEKNKKVKYFETIEYHSGSQKPIVFQVKHYNRIKFIEEKHPLLSLIKREDRENFITILQKDGIKYPMQLKYVLETHVISQNYAKIFHETREKNAFFIAQFQHPHLMHLLYSISLSMIGLFIIFILIKIKKH